MHAGKPDRMAGLVVSPFSGGPRLLQTIDFDDSVNRWFVAELARPLSISRARLSGAYCISQRFWNC